MAGRGELKPGDTVREFAQAKENNNGRIGEHAVVLDVFEEKVDSRYQWVERTRPVAKVRFLSDDTVLDIEFRYLKKVGVIDALGSLVGDDES